MATTPDFRVDGLTEVLAALTRIGLDVEDPQPALRDIAAEGARQVAATAPRRTGELAGSVRSSASSGQAVIEVTAPYAAVINYGWPGHNINPAGFLEQAEDPTATYALRRVGDEITSIIRKHF